METQKEKPGYEVAHDEARALFDSLGLTATVSKPKGAVQPAESKDSKPWPHVAFEFTVSNGRRSEAFEYRCGVGLVPWDHAKVARHLSPQGIDRIANPFRRFPEKASAADLMALGKSKGGCRPGYSWADDFLPNVAEIAAHVAKLAEWHPEPFEVLCNAAQDGRALLEAFEGWASDYGYDPDSRKALQTWEACCEAGRKVIRLVGSENAEKLAELAARF